MDANKVTMDRNLRDALNAEMGNAAALAAAGAEENANAVANYHAANLARRHARRDDSEDESDRDGDDYEVAEADEEQARLDAAEPMIDGEDSEDGDHNMDTSSASDEDDDRPINARAAQRELRDILPENAEPAEDREPVRWTRLVTWVLVDRAQQPDDLPACPGNRGAVLGYLLYHRVSFAGVGVECDGPGPTVYQRGENDIPSSQLNTSSRSHAGHEFQCGNWSTPDDARRVKEVANQFPVAIVALECVHQVMYDAAGRAEESTPQNVAESIANALAHRACRMHIVAPVGFFVMAELALHGVGLLHEANDVTAMAGLVAAYYQPALQRIEYNRLCGREHLLCRGRLADRALRLFRPALEDLTRHRPNQPALLELPVPYNPSPSSYLFGYTHLVCKALCVNGQGRQELEDWEALHHSVHVTQTRTRVGFRIKKADVIVGTFPSRQAAEHVKELLDSPNNGLYRVFIYAWVLMSLADWGSADAQAASIARAEDACQFHMPEVAINALASLLYDQGSADHTTVVAGVKARRCGDDARAAAAAIRTSYAHVKLMTPEKMAKLKARNDALFVANVWGG